jgi:hypothetical protein
VNLGDPKFTAAGLLSIAKKLIREERRWSCANSCSIDGGKNITAVEEGQAPIKCAGRCIRRTASTAALRTCYVAEGRISGVVADHSLEIVDLEIDRVRWATTCAHIGRGKRSGAGGAIPRGVGAAANSRRTVNLREEEPVRPAVNEAHGEGLAGEIGGEVVRGQVEHGRSARKRIVRFRAYAENQAPRHGRRDVVDRRQLDNHAVVICDTTGVCGEVEDGIGHLLVGVRILTESTARYKCGVATTAGGTKIIYRRRGSTSARVAAQSAVKRFGAYAQYAVCAQELLRVFVSPGASARYGKAWIRDNLNRSRSCRFSAQHDSCRCHGSP